MPLFIMIGQSLVNVNAGWRSRIFGIVASVGLLVFILFLSGYIEMIPMAAMMELMFRVAIETFE